MSLQLTPDLEQKLEHLAAETRRSPDDLAQEGLEQFLAQEEDILATVRRGRDDFAAGRVHEHDMVVARIEALLHSK
jgi:predicted transcriptional regulator